MPGNRGPEYGRMLASYVIGLIATAAIFLVIGQVTIALYGVNVMIVGAAADGDPFAQALSLSVTLLGTLLSLCIGVAVHRRTTTGALDHRPDEVFEPVVRDQPSPSWQ
jgi:urea transporter